MTKAEVTPNNIHIIDSYAVPKKRFGRELSRIHLAHPDCNVFQRSTLSLEHEWATHNFCYLIGFQRERTKDVDLNVPMKWYIEWLYFIVGALVWPWID